MTKRQGNRQPAVRIGGMGIDQRLELIVEAVTYCQRVKRLGMPASCYTRALREPVYFLWEGRRGSKRRCATLQSRAAVGLRFGKREVFYDHAVPFRFLQAELLTLDPITKKSVARILNRFGTTVIITSRENDQLNDSGLKDEMPVGWDRSDPLARYKAAGIELLDNAESYVSRA